MTNHLALENKVLYNRIKVMSNQYRFKILELTQNGKMSITELSSKLKLSYTKCSDYIRLLENERLITKERSGKETIIMSNVKIKENKLEFI